MNRPLLLIGCILVTLGIGLFAFSQPVPISAAALGGAFTVNSIADNTTKDTELTLREAILLANGGTGATGLNRTLSDAEKAQLGGCSWGGSSPNWTITGGCGDSIADTIYFYVYPGVTLLSYLPVINDTAPTTIIGSLGTKPYPVINAYLIGAHNGLRISSNNNAIYNLTIEGAPQNDFYIDGNINLLHEVRAWNAGSNGIYISGDSNTVESSQIGFDPTSSNSCVQGAHGNTGSGIYLASGSQYNTIQTTDVGCNAIGIYVETSATPGYHAVGPNNRVGINSYGAMPNGLVGVYVGSSYISMTATTVQSNSNIGVHVTGSSNSIYGNIVDSNNGDGIVIASPGNNNMIGCATNCLFGTVMGNIVTNNLNGLVLTGTTTSNFVMANRIGVTGSNGSAGNWASGILLYGAGNNYIGDGLSSVFRNRIGYNVEGITLDGNSFSNTIANNLIYNSSDGNGVLINGNAHDNAIGGSAQNGNEIYSNVFDGMRIYGYNNTINSNLIYANLYNGVYLLGNANGNVVGNIAVPNSIYSNHLDGVGIAGTAHNNTIGVNYIGTDSTYATTLGNLGNGLTIYGSAYNNVIGTATTGNVFSNNKMNGIVMSGANVSGNIMSSNHSEFNVQNGLLLTNGTHNNVIHQGGVQNYFVANSLNGILISLAAHDNTINSNQVSGNSHNGIELTDANTKNNVITGTVIFNNAMDGINERSSAAQNSWSHLCTYDDQGLGIDKFATSDTSNTVNGPLPQITSVAKNGGNVTVNGTASPSLFGTQLVMVEMYGMDISPTGFAQGKTYLGSSQTQLGTGLWSITYPASAPGCYVAFQTIVDNSGNSTSSEFSPNSCRVFLPLVIR